MARCGAAAIAGRFLRFGAIYGVARMNDRMGIEFIFWLNGHRHAMWFDESVTESRIIFLQKDMNGGGYDSLRNLCEAHYVDGVLVKGERP